MGQPMEQPNVYSLNCLSAQLPLRTPPVQPVSASSFCSLNCLSAQLPLRTTSIGSPGIAPTSVVSIAFRLNYLYGRRKTATMTEFVEVMSQLPFGSITFTDWTRLPRLRTHVSATSQLPFGSITFTDSS